MDWDFGLWLIGDGVDSREFGIGVTSLPKKAKPKERISSFPVPGRSGELTVSDDSFENIKKPFGLVFYGQDIEAAAEWLRGVKKITYSSEPDRAYSVAVPPDVQFERKRPSLYEFSVSFECFPLAAQYEPEEFDIVNGMIVVNPSLISAFPSFTAYGSGTIAVVIGSQAVTITGVSTSVTVEGGESFVCYDASGRADNRMTLTPASLVGYPTISGGAQVALSYSGASRVVFRPNWRFA